MLRTLVSRPEREVDILARRASRPRIEASPKSEKKKLAFVIAHLGPGGAQRVAVNAANALVERGCDVHVITVLSQLDAYQLDARVTRHCPITGTGNFAFIQMAAWANRVSPSKGPVGRVATRVALSISSRIALLPYADFIARIRWLRRSLRSTEADAILSFLTQTNILVILATRGLRKRVVISERNDPLLQRHHPRVELLRRIVYRWADVVTANSKGALTALEPFVPKHKLAFLPNPLMAASTSEAKAFGAPTVITIGRLVEQKGLDILLAAWAKVVEVLPDWRLAIVGGGPLEGELQALAAKLNIENSVDWIGHVSDPFPLLRGAEFFVLTSRFEGTPNAMLEAMVCGLPAIVSDASPGPCELIGPDESAGLIVPVEDVCATAEAIIRLARDEALRLRLGLAARERARAHEADQAIEVWLRLLRCE
jgi:glycosyltransferase involved in cell wall biosynthesis